MRQRLAAAARLRRAAEEAEPGGIEPGGAACAGADPGEEFERIMTLLRRWERRGGGIGPRNPRPSARRRMSFDDAILELDRALRVFGVRKGFPPAGPIPPGPGAPAGGG